MIILKIHRLSATFGRLCGQSLLLGDGLNILQASNETGKSTWCAFLTAMLYGVNGRERDRAGFIAEKNRYTPWSGAAMQGRMDCNANGREITLTRETKRSAAPMGEFRAVYAGTGDQVPGLTGVSCGETLLGIPREVFERSALIRQSGLAVTADPELERRIVSLITSGEEESSYTEAAAALKRQLNLRQHNKTGQIPAVQAELADVRRQLNILEGYQTELVSLRTQMEALNTQKREVERQLSQWRQYYAAQQNRQLTEARSAAEQARAEADTLRRQLEADHIPENEAIGRLRGAIVNLETVRKSLEKARAERDEAMKVLLRAEAAVNESPFAGQTAEQARKEVQAASPDRIPGSIALRELAIFSLFVAAAVGVFFLIYPRVSSLSLPLTQMVSWLLPGLAAALVAAAGSYISRLYRSRALEKLRNTALIKRFGTASQQEIAALRDTYIKSWEARDTAQANVNSKSANAGALYAALSSNEQGILLEVRRFAPSAFDIPTADRLLRDCALRRRALADADIKARDAALRYELQAQRAGTGHQTQGSGGAAAAPPVRSEEALSSALEELEAQQAALRSRSDHLTGQAAAIGDAAVLSAQAEQLEQRIAALGREYDALSLALDALDSANTTLQGRFSPELGRRAAEIFSQLTGGRYTGVALDRAFRLFAEPKGDSLYRDAQLLSAGAADQLYLAVRLAICQTVLPPEREVPLILDDALASFDDGRCIAALNWLREEAEHRQILLFTCHSREAAYFRHDSGVQIQVLTPQDAGV